MSNRVPRTAATSTGMVPVPAFSSVTVTFHPSPSRVFFGSVQAILGQDDLEKPLSCELIEGRRIRSERPHDLEKILEHGVIAIAVVGLDERLQALQGSLASHVIEQHPEDPSALVVGHGRVAGLRPPSIFTSGRSESGCRFLA